MSALAPLDRAGVHVELRERGLHVRNTERLTPALREHVRDHRDEIALELAIRGASTSTEDAARRRATATFRRQPAHLTPVLAPVPDLDAEAVEARPWWELDGWTVEGWIAEVEAVHVRVTWSGDRVTLIASRGFVPAWVCSDRYQLEQAGVLSAHFARASQRLEEPTESEGTPRPVDDVNRWPRGWSAPRRLGSTPPGSTVQGTSKAGGPPENTPETSPRNSRLSVS